MRCHQFIVLIAIQSAAFGQSQRVSRQGTQLIFQGKPFRQGGANMYWLGLDENEGGVAYPTKFRIDDALSTIAGMGVGVVRSHTLGISVGNPLSFETDLNAFNHGALDTIDYAVMRAGKLGIKLIVPLVDNYHYYHGGKCERLLQLHFAKDHVLRSLSLEPHG